MKIATKEKIFENIESVFSELAELKKKIETLEQENKSLKESIETKIIKVKAKEVFPKELAQKVIRDLKSEHRRRYGERMVDSRYVPYRKTYLTEHLYDDVEFILNHLHI